MGQQGKDLKYRGRQKDVSSFGVVDIESANWKDFLCLGRYSKETGYDVHRTLKGALDAIFKAGPDTYFAHFGGIFDFLFLIEAGLRYGYQVGDFIPRGSGLLSFTLGNKKRTITFRDSSAILPFGLGRLTESFQVEHRKIDYNVKRLTKVTPDLLKYLRHDCLGLYEVIDAFYKSPIVQRANPAFTVASQALGVFRSYIPEEKPVAGLPGSEDAWIRESYAGGRTEVFRPIWRGPGMINCYDVTSMYPFVMRENEFPGYIDKRGSKRLDLDRMGFCRCEVYVPDCYTPLLWKKDENSGKFLFPVGRFEGTWTLAELKEAVATGARITRIDQIRYFHSQGHIFRNFIDDMYRIRQASDPVQGIIAKLLMNSLYGRCGMNLDREGLDWDNGQMGVKEHKFVVTIDQENYKFCTVPVKLKSWTNVALASYVTAYARIHMWRNYLNPLGRSVYYTDTDSIYTPCVMPVSKELGALKFEGEMERACFYSSKTYFAGKAVMKGFDKKKTEHFQFEDFEACFEGETRLAIAEDAKLARFKTALRKGKILTLTKAHLKTLQSDYDKRIVIRPENSGDGNWDTLPRVIGECPEIVRSMKSWQPTKKYKMRKLTKERKMSKKGKSQSSKSNSQPKKKGTPSGASTAARRKGKNSQASTHRPESRPQSA